MNLRTSETIFHLARPGLWLHCKPWGTGSLLRAVLGAKQRCCSQSNSPLRLTKLVENLRKDCILTFRGGG